MNETEKTFLLQLERLGAEQARITASSPIPEEFRGMAALLGERTWQVLLGLSFLVSVILATYTYPLVSGLFGKGVLAWLLH